MKISGEFKKILKENGIKVPSNNPRNRFEKLIEDLFHQRWFEASKLHEELRFRISRINHAKDRLNEEWGKHEISICNPILRFRKPKQAEELIRRELLRFERIEDENERLAKAARVEWIRELIKNAPEGTVLIVIKNDSYIPDEENANKFNQRSQEGKSSFIAECNPVVKWVSFDPKTLDPSSEYLDCWDLTPKNSTIQYR